jgi:hypothetical protein
VSCPDAAASEVIEAAGGATDAVAVPAGDGAVADGDGAAAGVEEAGAGEAGVDPADVEEPLADEHPASVMSTPAAAASAARADGRPRTATDVTALPTPDVDPTPDKVPVLVTSPGTARGGIRNNDPGTPAFASRRVGQRKGKLTLCHSESRS